MKVLERASMPDGTDIQLEDWTKNNSHFKTLSVGAYPIAKNTSKFKWVEAGITFRLDLSRNFSNDNQVLETFNSLQNGEITLRDLTAHFYNGLKDQFYLGMIENINNQW